MRPLVLACVVALTAASCSADEVSGSTTSTAAPASSTSSTTSTITRSSTTSSTTTTTTTLLEGNWAEQPVIVADSWAGVVGWWNGTQWVAPTADRPPPLAGGEDFQALSLDGSSLVSSSGLDQTCEWSDTPHTLVRLDGENLELELGDDLYTEVAISAPWDTVPHRVRVQEDLEAHAGFASDVLAGLGLDVESPKVTQVVSTDLEGDGVFEKLVVAQDVEIQFDTNTEGYSIAFMRRIVDGEVETTIVDDDVIAPGELSSGSHMAITAVADLNGDGTMEVILSGHAYESSGVSVFELIADQLVLRLTSACGV